MAACKLLCDHRERIVLRHTKEFEGANYESQQLTTGDYAVTDPKGGLMAIIERKSLSDYGASLKDSRHLNKEKLVAIREKTNCAIIYIIEGKMNPGVNELFSGIPYKYIESSIFHLIMRERVCIIRTSDTLDTAKTLVRFLKSCDSLYAAQTKKTNRPVAAAATVSMDTADTSADTSIATADSADTDPKGSLDTSVAAVGSAEPPVGIALLNALTAKHVKSDQDVARSMWSKFRGISVVSADDYINTLSIAELLNGADPAKLKLSGGKPPTKRALMSLRTVDKSVEISLLSAIPGISKPMAAALLVNKSLREILSYGIEPVSIIDIPGKTKSRKLGVKRAADIFKFMNYKETNLTAGLAAGLAANLPLDLPTDLATNKLSAVKRSASKLPAIKRSASKLPAVKQSTLEQSTLEQSTLEQSMSERPIPRRLRPKQSADDYNIID